MRRGKEREPKEGVAKGQFMSSHQTNPAEVTFHLEFETMVREAVEVLGL